MSGRSDASEGSEKRTTIYDLARYTGYSAGTVSRVLNNRDRVKAETRRAILSAAKDLQLKPRAAARSRRIAVLSSPKSTDHAVARDSRLAAHVMAACSRRGMEVVFPACPLAQLRAEFLDGILVVSGGMEVDRLLESWERPVPVVYVNCSGTLRQSCRVLCDYFTAGYLAAKHLVSSGKSRLAYYGGDGWEFGERLRGFRAAIDEAGLPTDNRLLVQDGPADPPSVLRRLIRDGADSIYIPGASYQAMEALYLLTYVMGLSVPSDIAVIGAENRGLSSILNPPLTTIEEPLQRVSEKAVEIMDQLSLGHEVAESSFVIQVKLIERNSA